MPYTKKQVRWAFGTHQPFAERWAHEVKEHGLKKPGSEKAGHMKEAARRLRMKHSKKGK